MMWLIFKNWWLFCCKIDSSFWYFILIGFGIVVGISFIEVKNVVFGVMMYSLLRIFWGGNGEWNYVFGWS